MKIDKEKRSSKACQQAMRRMLREIQKTGHRYSEMVPNRRVSGQWGGEEEIPVCQSVGVVVDSAGCIDDAYYKKTLFLFL